MDKKGICIIYTEQVRYFFSTKAQRFSEAFWMNVFKCERNSVTAEMVIIKQRTDQANVLTRDDTDGSLEFTGTNIVGEHRKYM